MRLLIIRHGDPDYEHDTLTPRGEKEAELLAGWLSSCRIQKAYVSPLGRAKRTADIALQGSDIPREECGWLREFCPPLIHRPDLGEPDGKTIIWDWFPRDWSVVPEFYDVNHWCDTPEMQEGKVRPAYEEVIRGLDALLASHGYVHSSEGNYYTVTESIHDTICFFCHFGVECLLLSRMTGISPMLLWHGFCGAPTSITSLYTEERHKGIASFRINEFGATPHLLLGGQEVSRRARFVECYEDDGIGFEPKGQWRVSGEEKET